MDKLRLKKPGKPLRFFKVWGPWSWPPESTYLYTYVIGAGLGFLIQKYSTADIKDLLYQQSENGWNLPTWQISSIFRHLPKDGDWRTVPTTPPLNVGRHVASRLRTAAVSLQLPDSQGVLGSEFRGIKLQDFQICPQYVRLKGVEKGCPSFGTTWRHVPRKCPLYIYIYIFIFIYGF